MHEIPKELTVQFCTQSLQLRSMSWYTNSNASLLCLYGSEFPFGHPNDLKVKFFHELRGNPIHLLYMRLIHD